MNILYSICLLCSIPILHALEGGKTLAPRVERAKNAFEKKLASLQEMRTFAEKIKEPTTKSQELFKIKTEVETYQKGLRELSSIEGDKKLTDLVQQFETLSQNLPSIEAPLKKSLEKKLAQDVALIQASAENVTSTYKRALAFNRENGEKELSEILEKDFPDVLTKKNEQERNKALETIKKKAASIMELAKEDRLFTIAQRAQSISEIAERQKIMFSSTPGKSVFQEFSDINSQLKQLEKKPKTSILSAPLELIKARVNALKFLSQKNENFQKIQGLSLSSFERRIEDLSKEIQKTSPSLQKKMQAEEFTPIETSRTSEKTAGVSTTASTASSEDPATNISAKNAKELQSTKTYIKNLFSIARKHLELGWHDYFGDKRKASEIAQNLSDLYENMEKNLTASAYSLESARLARKAALDIKKIEEKLNKAVALYNKAEGDADKAIIKRQIGSAVIDLYKESIPALIKNQEFIAGKSRLYSSDATKNTQENKRKADLVSNELNKLANTLKELDYGKQEINDAINRFAFSEDISIYTQEEVPGENLNGTVPNLNQFLKNNFEKHVKNIFAVEQGN